MATYMATTYVSKFVQRRETWQRNSINKTRNTLELGIHTETQ